MEPRRSKRLKRARSSEWTPLPVPPPVTKKYKTMMEQVAVKKKPLRLVHDQSPPDDYTLVKYGQAEFTKFCLNLARKEGHWVWTAQENKHGLKSRPSNVDDERAAFHISRVGYYFPRHIIQKACKWFELSLAHDGTLHVDKSTQGKRLTQAEMRDRIMEIYPNLPEKDRQPILYRLEKGPGIGQAKNMNPYKMVELAVISHARHAHTDYDKLLRQGFDWTTARTEVGADIKKVLLEWKGENGNAEDEWETEFKELIDLTEDFEDNEESPPTSVSAVPQLPHKPRPSSLGSPPRGYRVALRPLPPSARVVDLVDSSPARREEQAPVPAWTPTRHYEWPPPPFQPPQHPRMVFRRLDPMDDVSRPAIHPDLSHLPPPPPNMAWKRLSADAGYLQRPAHVYRPPVPPPPPPTTVRRIGYHYDDARPTMHRI